MNNCVFSISRKKMVMGIATCCVIAAIVSLFMYGRAVAATGRPMTVVLKTPLALSEFQQVAARYNITVTELHYTQGDIQGGYTLKHGETIENALTKFRDAHNTFLTVATTKIAQALGETTETGAKKRLSALRDQFTAVSLQNSQEGLRIDSLDTESEQVTQKLDKAGYVKSFITKQSAGQKVSAAFKQAVRGGFALLVGVAEASNGHEAWAPYGGDSDVRQAYTFQTFYFNNVGNFGANDTYEHETQVYDKNFADYAGYWSCNMPRAYHDTPFLDGIDNFTVGSAAAASLRNNVQYYTHMTFLAGPVRNATVRIKGQKGHRSPNWCYSTWCIFSDATTQSMATFNAPAGMSWQY